MAGIGVKLNNIYGKRTLTTNIIGMGYSTVMTIAPMLTVIGALCIMEHFLGFDSSMFLPDIVDLLLWYWGFILCCTCRSVKIIRKFPFSL